MTEVESNYTLREEIIAYWSDRAQTFDQSFGHRIVPGIEARAWAELIGGAIGQGPKTVLELACGTGEITRILLGLGYDVTGLDFAEPMLAKARAKHGNNPAVRFRLGDAENSMEPDASYDAVISRHLVWTLLAPQTSFIDWHRVLKPGGTLLIFDGCWSEPNRFGRLAAPAIRLLDRLSGRIDAISPEMMQRHGEIVRRLPFRDGLTASSLADMLEGAGFVDIEPLPARPIIRAQTRVGTLRDALRIRSNDLVFLKARRPG
jgi:SAM-dependent methyltransferase